MIRLTPRYTRTGTLLPHTTLFRSPPVPFEGMDSLRLPTFVIDAHRQVIWSFTLEHVAIAPWFGVGMNVVNNLPGAHELIHGINAERSEEHTSELQSLMRISYADFCLTKKNMNYTQKNTHTII